MRSAVVLVAVVLARTALAEPAPNTVAAEGPDAEVEAAVSQPAESELAEPAPAEPELPQPPASAPAPTRPRYIPPTPDELARLTDEERELYRSGRVDPAIHGGGVVASIFVGFGLGHVVQGRWLQRGWIFTLGETAGMVAGIYGYARAKDECTLDVRCSSTGVKIYVGGMVALIGFYAGGVLETWITPSRHNARLQGVYRKLHRMRPTPYVAPTEAQGGGVAGVSLAF